MKNQLFLPDNLTVGYQERTGTYTGKLAYVVYKDEKNVLRKEKSWRGWIDENLGIDEFENVPTEGFVINKNVGGYNYGWHSRQAKIRVYDPRGFEIEITIENLLYILANSAGMSYKGLEGEFIYAWDKQDLVLIPCSSSDYKEIKTYNDLLRSDFKLTGKTIVIGNRYITDKEKEVIYLGRYNEFYYDYSQLKKLENKNLFELQPKNRGKKYWFYNLTDSVVEVLPLSKIKGLLDDNKDINTSKYQEQMFKLKELYDVKVHYHEMKTEEDVKVFLEKVYKGLINKHNRNYSDIILYEDKDGLSKNLKKLVYNFDYSLYASHSKLPYIKHSFKFYDEMKIDKYYSDTYFIKNVSKEDSQEVIIKEKSYKDLNDMEKQFNLNTEKQVIQHFTIYSCIKEINFTFEEFYNVIKDSYIHNELLNLIYQEYEYVNSELDKFVPIGNSIT